MYVPSPLPIHFSGNVQLPKQHASPYRGLQGHKITQPCEEHYIYSISYISGRFILMAGVAWMGGAFWGFKDWFTLIKQDTYPAMWFSAFMHSDMDVKAIDMVWELRVNMKTLIIPLPSKQWSK